MKYVYKIIAAIGSLSVIPLIVFAKTIYYKISSVAVGVLVWFSQSRGSEAAQDIIDANGGELPKYMADNTSLKELFDLVSKVSGEGGEMSEALSSLIAPVATFLVILLGIAVCGILCAVFAIFAKNNRKVIYTGLTGIGLSMMATYAFDSISSLLLDGTVSFSSILGSSWADLLGSFEEISLNSVFWFIPLVFVAVIVWTVLYNFTLPQNEKRERKLMLGEADE